MHMCMCMTPVDRIGSRNALAQANHGYHHFGGQRERSCGPEESNCAPVGCLGFGLDRYSTDDHSDHVFR